MMNKPMKHMALELSAVPRRARLGESGRIRGEQNLGVYQRPTAGPKGVERNTEVI